MDFAAEFKQGAIFFDSVTDKEGYQRLVPISSPIREEIELYRGRNPHIETDGPLSDLEIDNSIPTLLHEAERVRPE